LELDGTGAYCESSWIVTSERPVFLSGWMSLTLPTGTPEMRTSASLASVVASGKLTTKR
jgi:hypothetical protein